MTIRLRVRVVLLAAALAAVVVMHPSLARAAGVDFWNLDEARAELAAASARTEVLADRDDTIMRRIVLKESLVDDLVAGRTDLPTVAARFLELNADEPTYLDAIRTSVRGDSDLERSGRIVIDYASARTDDAALIARLEVQLARMQDADHPAR